MSDSLPITPTLHATASGDESRGVRLTIHHSLTNEVDVDVEVARGTAAREILAAFSEGPMWCGAEPLGPTHPAGQWPLVAGAILSAHRRLATVAPAALHLAAIAGPDAGVMIPIDAVTVTVIGSAPVIGSTPPTDHGVSTAIVKDDAIDARHATVSLTPAGGIRVRDHGSVNGTGVWRLRRGAYSWGGRRRTSVVRIGDLIAIGCTLLEARQGIAPALVAGADADATTATTTGAPALPIAATAPMPPAGGTLGLMGALSRAMPPVGLLRRLTDRVRGAPAHGHLQPPVGRFPDPTRMGGWSGDITIGGTHAIGLARAVTLARGRRPPSPMPLEEAWLSWLPPALADDGHIRLGAAPFPVEQSPSILLIAESDRTTSRIETLTTVGPVVRVSSATADILARARAGSTPDPPPRTVLWADAVALAPRAGRVGSGHSIVTGVSLDSPSVPWEMTFVPGSPFTIVAGAEGSGKTTLVATIAGALAVQNPPSQLALVVLCAGAPGALGPYLDLPHVTSAASHVRTPESLHILDSLDTSLGFTVIIVDDIDALGPDGRAVTARLEDIATRAAPGRVHVVIATQRPTAVLTPTLRSRTATGIALRTTCESDSLEVTGVVGAASIPMDAQGTAFARSAGGLEKVLVALPYATKAPPAQRYDAPLSASKTLAAAARDAMTTTS